MIDSPQTPWTWSLTSFFSFSTPTLQQLTRKLWPAFRPNLSLPLAPPHRGFSQLVRITTKKKKKNKANIPVMPGEVFISVLLPPMSKHHSGQPSFPRHVLADFSFMPFWLEMSWWRILFCACQRTSMFFMTFMNVTSLGTRCLSVWAGCSQTWSHCDQDFQFWGWLIHQLGVNKLAESSFMGWEGGLEGLSGWGF